MGNSDGGVASRLLIMAPVITLHEFIQVTALFVSFLIGAPAVGSCPNRLLGNDSIPFWLFRMALFTDRDVSVSKVAYLFFCIFR